MKVQFGRSISGIAAMLFVFTQLISAGILTKKVLAFGEPLLAITTHPDAVSPYVTPTFGFSTTQEAEIFCSIDGGMFSICTDPYTTEPLASGPHTFSAYARNESNGTGPTDSYSWVVDITPPETTIDLAPNAVTLNTSSTFAFSSIESPVTFDCKVDSASYTPCVSPYITEDLLPGDHSFYVRAHDEAGNTDLTPAVYNWTVNTVSDGDGTPEHPIIIHDCSELQAMNDEPSLLSAHYALTENIDCTGSEDYNSGNGFLPIGQSAPFTGTFDGGGHTISNLQSNIGENYGGLFAQTSGATIQSLTLSQSVIEGNQCTGGITGSSTNDSITNITVSDSTISGNDRVGGVAGCAMADNGTSTFSHISVDGYANIIGVGNEVGGIVGYFQTDNQGVVSVSNTAVNGAITGVNTVAGVVGVLETYGQTTASINGNTVDASFSVPNNSYNVGGVLGYLYNNQQSTVTVNENSVSGSLSAGSNTGGVVGYIDTYQTADASVNNNAVTLDITGHDAYSGGIVGYFYGSYAGASSVNNNVYNGSVSGTEYVGGIVGYLDIQHSQTSKINNNLSSGTVGGGSYLGGIAGYAYYEGDYGVSEDIQNSTINQNMVDGTTISGTSSYAGGAIGYLESYGGVELQNNFNKVVDSTVSTDYYAGGMFGYLYLYGQFEIGVPVQTADISKNQIDATVTADSDYAGGVASYVQIYYGVTATLNQNIVAGDISGFDITGGVIGYLDAEGYVLDSTVNISNSYVTASVSTESNYSGGVIGQAYIVGGGSGDEEYNGVLNLNNVYASGSVSGVDNVAGLIGSVSQLEDNYSHVNISNSFSAAAITHDPSLSFGALVGYFGGADDPGNFVSTKNFYDQVRSGEEVPCSSILDPFDGCKAVNTSSSPDVSYFKNDNAREPLQSWDFLAIWGFSADLNDNLPCLQLQEGCTGIHSTTDLLSAEDGTPIRIDQTGCVAVGSSIAQKESGLAVQDPAYSYPVGFVGFNLNGCSSTVSIGVTFTTSLASDKVTVRKYNSSTHAYTTLTAQNSGLAITQTTFNSKPGLILQYQITDNGPLDENPTVGAISDPIGLGVQAVAAPNTGLGWKAQTF